MNSSISKSYCSGFLILCLFGFFPFSAKLLSLSESDIDLADPVNRLAFTEKPWIDTSDKDAVIQLFNSEFSKSSDNDIFWNGSHDSCKAGNNSQELIDSTIERVNYFRAMAGVPARVVEEPVYSAKAIHASLMMSSEGSLDHNPSRDYQCYNQFGSEAAANSNLYLGRIGSDAINGYIEDPGEDNNDVGHRNTILYPPTREMGVANIPAVDDKYSANTLWVFDDFVFSDWPELREENKFVAWPPRGYVPSNVVYPRWSFSIHNANFESTEVVMTDLSSGEVIDLHVVKKISVRDQVPTSVIVWEPVLPSDSSERSYQVSIKNVVLDDSNLSNYDYIVKII